MLQRIKKVVAIIIIIVLLPYIITIFINGSGVEQNIKTDERDKRLKDYCIRVLAKEVSSDYEDEMLRVQAILVRTTIYKEVEELGESIFEKEGFGDESDIDASWYKKLEKIWDETEGKVVVYEGELAFVPFHQVSNGKTRNAKEVLSSDTYPYLQIIECPKDVEADNQMASKFISVTGVTIESTDTAGYVLSVKVGEETCSGENFREAYGLASGSFEVQDFADNTRIITKGVGHGLGLSQYTANEMAKDGKNYQEILQHFYPGTEIQEVAEILWNVE